MAETSPWPRFDDSLAIFAGDLRGWVFPSQVEAGRYFGLTHATISRYENGHIKPRPGYLACLACLIIEQLAHTEQAVDEYQAGLLQEVNSAFRWCYPGEEPLRDWAELCAIAETFRAKCQRVEQDAGLPSQQKADWGDAPEVRVLYGRGEELERLRRWIITDGCRLVVILGMGGIGKTALATRLMEQIQDRFEYIIWRSLRNTPTIDDILGDCLRLLSDPSESEMPGPASADQKISLLIDYLRKARCLLALDSAEAILRHGDTAGRYLEGFEAYGDLIRQIGETQHQSCLVLTSRERPSGIARLEGGASPVKTCWLRGLTGIDGQRILQDRNLTGSEEARTTLVDSYSGNPLALRLVAEMIDEVFVGDIQQFLDYGTTVFGGIRWQIDQQFDRLSELELEIMYWLAIKREAASVEALRASIVHTLPTGAILEALSSLRRRSLVERSANGILLHDIVSSYTTERMIDQICEEIVSGEVLMLQSHALIEAQAKERARQSQVRHILDPISQRVWTALDPVQLERKLQELLATLRNEIRRAPGYAGGNILNLLLHLGIDIRGYNFSGVAVRQAYLRDVVLPEVNLAGADLTASVLTDAFAGVEAIALSPNEELLALGTGTEICLWRVDGEQLCAVLRGHSKLVWSVAFSPNGKLLASGSADQTVRLWDVGTMRTLAVLRGHTDRVWSVAFSPDGQTLASGSEDQSVRLWDVPSGRTLRILQGHTNTVFSVAFDSGGHVLASGSADRTVRLWETATGEAEHVLHGHTGPVACVAFQPESHLVASGSNDQTIRLWDSRIGRSTCVLSGHDGAVSAITFALDGTVLVSGSYDNTIRLWEIEAYQGRPGRVLTGHVQEVRSVACCPYGGELLASGSYDRTIRLWNIKTGRLVRTLRGSTQEIWAIALSRDGQTLASCGTDHVIRLWDVRTGRVRHSLQGHVRWATSVAFSPDGRLLASGSYDRTARLWDFTTGRPLHILANHANWVWFVAFSPDGRFLASGGTGRKVHLWDINTRQAKHALEGHCLGIRCAAFHPDGVRLASGSEDHTVRLWDVDSGQTLHVLEAHHGPVSSVDFSPDGALLASGAADQAVWLWDIRSGQPSRALQEHTAPVSTVAFSPDGAILASGSADRTVVLWDIRASQVRRILRGHAGAVSSVAFSPDGNTLASADLDGAIKVWSPTSYEHPQTLRVERPYERMNISGAIGLTDAQKAALKALGAVEDEE